MTSALDVQLHDDDLNTEIELLAELMVLASESAEPLDARIIDATLGVTPALLPRQRRAA